MFHFVFFLLKEFLAVLICLLSPIRRSGGSILMYHSIGINKKFSTVAPEVFDRQLQFLQRSSYNVISLHKLITKLRNRESLASDVVLTFDDAYEDFYTNAYPLLKQYKLPATLFVPTGMIGSTMTVSGGKETFEQMTAQQIKEVSDSGLVDVMPHTVHHMKLTRLPFDEAQEEIERSRSAVEDITGKAADIFAYPSGKYTNEVVSYLSASGTWLGAVTVKQGSITHISDPFQLKRNSIDSSVGMNQFKMRLSSVMDKYLRMVSYKSLLR